jgi:CHAD domain-containing protein
VTRPRAPGARPPAAAPRDGAVQATTALQPLLSRLVSEQSEHYVRAVAAARKRPGRAAVHVLRVATRRLLAMRELVRFAGPSACDGTLERYLSEPFRPCGRLRDLQVIQRRVRALLPRFPEAQQFLRALKQRERKAKARAARALDEAHPRRVARLLARLVTKIDEVTADRAGRNRAIRLVALQIGAARRAAKAAHARAKTGDPDLIHHARLALKAHRYMVELAESLGLHFVASEVEGLSRLQAEMGEITDRTMLLHALDAYRDEHPRAGARMALVRATVARERTRLIARYLAADRRPASLPADASTRAAVPAAAHARRRRTPARRRAPVRAR